MRVFDSLSVTGGVLNGCGSRRVCCSLVRRGRRWYVGVLVGYGPATRGH